MDKILGGWGSGSTGGVGESFSRIQAEGYIIREVKSQVNSAIATTVIPGLEKQVRSSMFKQTIKFLKLNYSTGEEILSLLNGDESNYLMAINILLGAAKDKIKEEIKEELKKEKSE